jgi:hypothetical protein
MIISPDKFLTDINGDYKWTPKSNSEAWTRCYRELGKELMNISDGNLLMMSGLPASGKSSLLEGHHNNEEVATTLKQQYDVIFDATFSTRISRSGILNIAIGAGWTVDCLYMSTPLQECLDRNVLRQSVKNVPGSVITAMYDKFDRPELSEGFKEVLTYAELVADLRHSLGA